MVRKFAPKGAGEKFILRSIDHHTDSCVIWPYGRDSLGYARATAKGFSTRLAHRIVCEIVYGPPPFRGAVARHLCNNGHHGCINYAHLAWGTVFENNRDKVLNGTQPRGEASGKSVLTESDIPKIMQMSKSGASQRQIGLQFSVTAGTIQAVLEGRTWRHVSKEAKA